MYMYKRFEFPRRYTKFFNYFFFVYSSSVIRRYIQFVCTCLFHVRFSQYCVCNPLTRRVRDVHEWRMRKSEWKERCIIRVTWWTTGCSRVVAQQVVATIDPSQKRKKKSFDPRLKRSLPSQTYSTANILIDDSLQQFLFLLFYSFLPLCNYRVRAETIETSGKRLAYRRRTWRVIIENPVMPNKWSLNAFTSGPCGFRSCWCYRWGTLKDRIFREGIWRTNVHSCTYTQKIMYRHVDDVIKVQERTGCRELRCAIRGAGTRRNSFCLVMLTELIQQRYKLF